MLFQKVIDYCKNNDLSISAFEKKCNLSNGTVSKWKSMSDEQIRLNTLKRIAVGTGIPVEQWLKE